MPTKMDMSFKCLNSVAVVAQLWLPTFHWLTTWMSVHTKLTWKERLAVLSLHKVHRNTPACGSWPIHCCTCLLISHYIPGLVTTLILAGVSFRLCQQMLAHTDVWCWSVCVGHALFLQSQILLCSICRVELNMRLFETGILFNWRQMRIYTSSAVLVKFLMQITVM